MLINHNTTVELFKFNLIDHTIIITTKMTFVIAKDNTNIAPSSLWCILLCWTASFGVHFLHAHYQPIATVHLCQCQMLGEESNFTSQHLPPTINHVSHHILSFMLSASSKAKPDYQCWQLSQSRLQQHQLILQSDWLLPIPVSTDELGVGIVWVLFDEFC